MLDDFIGDMLMVGSEGKGWQSWFVIAFIVLGAVAGGWIGYTSDGVLWAAGGTLIGAFAGWIIGIIVRGFLIIGALIGVALALGLGWMWLTGGLAG